MILIKVANLWILLLIDLYNLRISLAFIQKVATTEAWVNVS